MNIHSGSTKTKEGAEVTETIYIGTNFSKKTVTVNAHYNSDDNHCSQNYNIIESATNFLIESGLNLQGPTGEKGDQGEQGPTGEQGPPGPDGAPVSLSTILSVGNNCGTTGIDFNNNNIENVNTISSNTALTLSSSHSDINLTTNNGKINANSDIILKDANEPTWIATLEIGGLSFNTSVNQISIDADGANIQVNGHSGYSSLQPSTLTLNDSGIQTIMDKNSITTSGSDLTLTSSDNIVFNSTGIKLTGSDFINITANNDSMSLTAGDDITLTSTEKGIVINAGTGDAGNNDITLTTQNSTLVGNIVLNSGGGIQLDAQNSSMSLSANDDITIQSAGLGSVLLNAPNMNSYGYALPICLNHFASSSEYGNWSYTLGGQQFQDVFAGSAITITLPPQFFADTPQSGYTSTRWQINFDMNCWNFANAGDKGFAIYLSFLDNNNNPYEPFLYNQLTPYCKLDNHSSFSNQSCNQFKSIHFCDYIDFGGLAGSFDSNIRLQMNIAGDNQYNNIEFKFKLGFTRIQRV
jgi:hypothetical protein